MTRLQHLLLHLAEECNEVGQRASKAMKFGLHEVQKDQLLDNAERITAELADLIGVYEMLVAEGAIIPPTAEQVAAKKAKVEKYLLISKACGTLDNEDAAAMVHRVVSVCHDNTESFEHGDIGMQLAYLTREMTSPNPMKVQWYEDENSNPRTILTLFRSSFSPVDPVWKYIQIL